MPIWTSRREYLSPRRKARTVSDPLGELGGFARRKFDPDTDASYGQPNRPCGGRVIDGVTEIGSQTSAGDYQNVGADVGPERRVTGIFCLRCNSLTQIPPEIHSDRRGQRWDPRPYSTAQSLTDYGLMLVFASCFCYFPYHYA